MEAILPERFDLGECPRWDEQLQQLWWVDINAHRLHRWEPASGEHRQLQLPEPIGCFALRQDGGLVAGLQSGLWLIDSLESGQLTQLGDPEAHLPHQRFNDGRCDGRGRFIAGTMNPDKDDHFGTFYRLDPAHAITPLVGRSWTCNGLAFSPDQRTLYWADTPGSTIYRCDYDIETGQVANQRPFFVVPEGWGRPDGAAVDSEGAYWCALYGGGQVLRIAPDGTLLQQLPVPVSNPTMVAFGGPELRTLYITSARQKMTAAQLEANPLEGALLSCPAPVAGLPEARFRG